MLIACLVKNRKCMQARLAVLFKSADDAVKEPWESPQRGLGRLVMWLNISSLLTTNVQCLSFLFFSFVLSIALLVSTVSLFLVLVVPSCIHSPPPPLLYQYHGSHVPSLAPRQPGLAHTICMCVSQPSHYYNLLPVLPFAWLTIHIPRPFHVEEAWESKLF